LSGFEKYSDKVFDEHRKVNENGEGFWYARDMQKVLEYHRLRNFKHVILKAKQACEGSKHEVSDHSADVSKMVEPGLNA